MISEQPLDFVLRKSVPDAADSRNQRHCEERPAEGLRPRRKEHEYPCDAVNPGLYVDRRKQARNVGRRSRVCIRQPGVKWYEACLDCKPEKARDEQQRQGARVPSGLACDIREVPAAGPVVEHNEKDVEEKCARVRGHEIPEPAPPNFRSVFFQHDGEIG